MSLRIAILCLAICTVYCQLTILAPADLRKYWNQTKPKTAIANFGYVPWGRKLTGEVYQADPYKACTPLKAFQIAKEKAENPDTYPIVLAERGGCSFTQKAQNAQMAGARMLIIVDTLNENLELTMPVGDGHDSSVHIPTVMIAPQHGTKIKDYLEHYRNQPEDKREIVTISMNFEFPKNQDKNVKVELWLSGTDEHSFKVVSDLKPYIERLGPNVTVNPHYAVWYCPYCKEANYKTTENLNCLSGGRYCSPDPDEDGPLDGRDILYEDLRQLCLAQISISAWLNYMAHYDPKCPVDKKQMEECSDKALKYTEISSTVLKGCVSSTFNGSNQLLDENWMLKNQRLLFKRRGIQVWPSVLINGFLYRGNLIPATNVYEAICEAFEVMPENCSDYFHKKKSDTIFEEHDEIDLMSVVVWVAIIGALFLVGALFFYRRWIRRELMRDLNNQLNAKISEYMAMQDEERGHKGRIQGTDD